MLHLAAKVDVVGPWPEYQRINVDGTRSVLAACRAGQVSRLVYVSSPSVAHAGAALVARVRTADPLTARSNYSRSKAMAERLALAADGAELAVLAIRPHLIWGPGDTQLVQPIIDRAPAGRLPLIGSGTALIDTTYVDNAVRALIAAVDVCGPVHGEALVVSNGEPRPVGGDPAASLRGGRSTRSPRSGPLPVARAAGSVVEAAWRAARRPGYTTLDPIPRRTTRHRTLVRPTADQGGAELGADSQPDEGFESCGRATATKPADGARLRESVDIDTCQHQGRNRIHSIQRISFRVAVNDVSVPVQLTGRVQKVAHSQPEASTFLGSTAAGNALAQKPPTTRRMVPGGFSLSVPKRTK